MDKMIAFQGSFAADYATFQTKARSIRAFVFDWDGVFNAGTKDATGDNAFSEPDSMGLNMLRFAWWQMMGEALPPVAIISGANAGAARRFATREHLNALYLGYKDKTVAIAEFAQKHQLSLDQIAFSFDDILDFSAAAQVGLRILIQRKSSPLTTAFAQEHGLCDYVTHATGGQHAVRELSELLMGSVGLFEETVAHRMAWKPHENTASAYQQYLTMRNEIPLDMKVQGQSGHKLGF